MARAFFILVALVFAATIASSFYAAARTSGDNIGGGAILMAAVVLFVWSVIGERLVAALFRRWNRTSSVVRGVQCAALLIAFAAPTGFFAWFATIFMIGYFRT
jgi:hypothetical protein